MAHPQFVQYYVDDGRLPPNFPTKGVFTKGSQRPYVEFLTTPDIADKVYKVWNTQKFINVTTSDTFKANSFTIEQAGKSGRIGITRDELSKGKHKATIMGTNMHIQPTPEFSDLDIDEQISVVMVADPTWNSNGNELLIDIINAIVS